MLHTGQMVTAQLLGALGPNTSRGAVVTDIR